MKKHKTIIILWVLLGVFLPEVGSARDREYTESYGVDITLKNQEKLCGYMDWYPEVAHVSVFLEKLNVLAKDGTPIPSNVYWWHSFVLHKKFEKILYPFNTYVATREDTREIELQDIAEINIDPKLDLKINTTYMKPVPAKDIHALSRTPIYILSERTNKFWGDYYLVFSSDTIPEDLIDYRARFAKSIVFFGELIGMYKFENSRLECVSQKKDALAICNAAKQDWVRLEKESDVYKDCIKRREDAFDLVSKTTDYQSAFKADEYRKAEADCFSIEKKLTKEYYAKRRGTGDNGIVHILFSTQYTLLSAN